MEAPASTKKRKEEPATLPPPPASVIPEAILFDEEQDYRPPDMYIELVFPNLEPNSFSVKLDVSAPWLDFSPVLCASLAMHMTSDKFKEAHPELGIAVPMSKKPKHNTPVAAREDVDDSSILGLLRGVQNLGSLMTITLPFNLSGVSGLGPAARCDFLEMIFNYKLREGAATQEVTVKHHANSRVCKVPYLSSHMDIVPGVLIIDAIRIANFLESPLIRTLADHMMTQRTVESLVKSVSMSLSPDQINYLAARAVFAMEHRAELKKLGYRDEDIDKVSKLDFSKPHALVAEQQRSDTAARERETIRNQIFALAKPAPTSQAPSSSSVYSARIQEARVLEMTLRGIHAKGLWFRQGLKDLMPTIERLASKLRGLRIPLPDSQLRQQLEQLQIPVCAHHGGTEEGSSTISLSRALVSHMFLDPLPFLAKTKQPGWWHSVGKQTSRTDILFYPLTAQDHLKASSSNSFVPNASANVQIANSEVIDCDADNSDDSLDEALRAVQKAEAEEAEAKLAAAADDSSSSSSGTQLPPIGPAPTTLGFSSCPAPYGDLSTPLVCVSNMALWPKIVYQNVHTGEQFVDWTTKRCGEAFAEFLFGASDQANPERERWPSNAWVAGGWVMRALVCDPPSAGVFDCDIFVLAKQKSDCLSGVQSLIKRIHDVMLTPSEEGMPPYSQRLIYVVKLTHAGQLTVIIEGCPVLVQIHTVVGYDDIATYVFDCFNEPHTQCYLSGSLASGFRLATSVACIRALQLRVTEVPLVVPWSVSGLKQAMRGNEPIPTVVRNVISSRCVRIIKALMKGFAVKLKYENDEYAEIVSKLVKEQLYYVPSDNPLVNKGSGGTVNASHIDQCNAFNTIVARAMSTIAVPAPSHSDEQAAWIATIGAAPKHLPATYVCVHHADDVATLKERKENPANLLNELIGHVASCALNEKDNITDGYMQPGGGNFSES